MPRTIKVRHPAGVIDLGDGMSVDVQLRASTLGSLVHARVPVMMVPSEDMCPACDGTGMDPGPGEPRERKQVGTAVLMTYRTLLDGSAVDLEVEIELDSEKPVSPPNTVVLKKGGDGGPDFHEVWEVGQPAAGVPYRVVREAWNDDLTTRTILEIRLL